MALEQFRPPRPQGLSIRTFNIRNGRGFGLTQAIRAVHIGGLDLMILTEINVTDLAYFQNRLGYNVVCLPEIMMEAVEVQGRLCLVVRDQPKGWSAESTHFHGPNVVNYEVVDGVKKNPLIGEYLPTFTLEKLPDLEDTLTRFRDQ